VNTVFWKRLAVAISLGISAGMAQAATVAQHQGQTDPLTEGFTFDATAGAVVSGGNDGTDHWSIQILPDGEGSYRHPIDSASFSDPQGWTVSAQVKVITAGGHPQLELQVIDGQDIWSVRILDGDSGTQGLWTAFRNDGDIRLAALDPTDGYHWYQMYYDAGNARVEHYVDGQLVGALTRDEVVSHDAQRLLWGDNYSTGSPQTESRWAVVAFETGKNIVPEPATLLLLVPAALCLIVRRRMA